MLPKSSTAAAGCTELFEVQVNNDHETAMKRLKVTQWVC